MGRGVWEGTEPLWLAQGTVPQPSLCPPAWKLLERYHLGLSWSPHSIDC